MWDGASYFGQTNPQTTGGYGWYAFYPQPGQYRVEIRQPRSSKRRIPKPFGTPGETIEGTEESIHETYNDTSTLRAVLEAGANEVDFTLRLRT